jgi:lysophospholipase L1-like esterase
MQTLQHHELLDSPIEITGALGFDHRPKGLSPRRLPDWTRPQTPEIMDVMVRMPSGVRLSFAADTREIRLNVQTTRMVTPPATPRLVTFDLRVNSESIISQSYDNGNTIVLNPTDPTDFEMVRGDAFEVQFADLPAGENQFELWLPQNVFVEIRAIHIDENANFNPPTHLDKRWIHYGSSISHCMESLHPTGTWPAVASLQAGVDLHSFGFAGQCHLDQFVARSIRDVDADYISLKIGINVINADSMRERVFTSALHGFLDTIREKKPDTPILLVSPIYCPSAENHPGPTIQDKNGKFVTYPGSENLRQGCMSLKRVRELISQVTTSRQNAGDNNLSYISGLELFGESDAGSLPDDLHPDPDGYRLIGERFAKKLFSVGGAFSSS